MLFRSPLFLLPQSLPSLSCYSENKELQCWRWELVAQWSHALFISSPACGGIDHKANRAPVDTHPAQPDIIPWGWWDIARVVGLLLVSLLLMFFALVGQAIFRGRSTDPVIESQTINLAFYISWLLAIYWCSVRRYGITWAAIGLRRVAWWWVITSPVCLVGMQIIKGLVEVRLKGMVARS
jgi:hypothetical protein